MSKLPERLMQGFLCLAAALIIAAPPATADGNASLFSSDISAFSGTSSPLDMPAPMKLLYSGREAVSIDSKPENLFVARNSANYSQADLACLAEALYFEARGESRKGQAAVAEVILNRVDSRAFPSTVCDVIHQPQQFSYTIGGRKAIKNKKAYQHVLAVAETALTGAPRNLTDGATYFHTPSVRPAWSHRFHRTTQIGSHIFYRSNSRIASN